MVSTPTEDVPPEILSLVFIHYCHLTRPNTAAMTLGRVSRRWRAIALNTPFLWSSIDLKGHALEIARFLPTINLWLSRSNDLPCIVRASVWVTDDDESPSVLRYILDPVASRIEELWLEADLDELKSCLVLFERGLPRLRELGIGFYNEAPVEELDISASELPLRLSSCPQLESVFISPTISQILGPHGLVAALPESTTTLPIELFPNLEPTTIFDLLFKCRRLIQLVADVLEMSEWFVQFDDEISLQFLHTSLQRLTLTCGSQGASLRTLFQAVHFPFLVDLSLDGISDAADVLRCVAGVSSQLKRVIIRNCPVAPVQLLEALERIPTIIDLQLLNCGCFTNEWFISSVTVSDRDATHRLPNLKRFDIGCDQGSSLAVTDRIIVEFIESRWNVREGGGFSRIEHVGIWDEREMGEEWWERLSLMRVEGLSCSLQGYDSRAMQLRVQAIVRELEDRARMEINSAGLDTRIV
ncbi:hypothetical protein AX16_009283 [Volvariella volvacea WC 439]|nr:hypothetical protein AX16_009283 [Volvariella volvacea WC 439]